MQDKKTNLDNKGSKKPEPQNKEHNTKKQSLGPNVKK